MNHLWLQYIDRITKWLGLTIFICLILLIILQGLLQIDSFRQWLVPVERWEGKQLLLQIRT